MPNWEYKIVSIKSKGGVLRQITLPETFREECNNVGRDGWELVSALPLCSHQGRTSSVELVFKRPR